MMVLFWNIVLLSIFTVVNSFALPFEGLFKLDIIHYNDFHARFQETSVNTPTCRADNDSCLGGFPRLFYEIETLLREKPDAILLNAGDSFQGTYWYTLLKWNVTQEFMNLLPHDAHAIGNHEFDDGPSGLAPYLKHLKAPVLAANMDTSEEPILQHLYKPHIVIERNERKIGIIGLITPDTKSLSRAGNVTFESCQEVARREAMILTDMGVDIIILLSHCGLSVDKEIARDYGELIDIIIGGHTHSLLWNGPTPSGEKADGPYPVFVQSTVDQRHKTLIVQASAFTKYIGNLTVSFNYLGHYVRWEGGPIFLNRSIPEDADMKARLQPYASIVRAAEDVPIGSTEETLDYTDCVYGECALGDLMVDAFNEQAKASLSSERDFISLVQRGDIKSSFLQGKITQGEVFELLPYNDRLQSFEIEGKYLREALERSVMDAWATDPFKGPWVLQVSGLQVTYNISRPEGQRMVAVSVGSGRALDDGRWYQLTTPSYLGDGGDGFTMFKDNRRNMEIIGRDQTVVEDYIKKRSPLNISKGARITITY